MRTAVLSVPMASNRVCEVLLIVAALALLCFLLLPPVLRYVGYGGKVKRITNAVAGVLSAVQMCAATVYLLVAACNSFVIDEQGNVLRRVIGWKYPAYLAIVAAILVVVSLLSLKKNLRFVYNGAGVPIWATTTALTWLFFLFAFDLRHIYSASVLLHPAFIVQAVYVVVLSLNKLPPARDEPPEKRKKSDVRIIATVFILLAVALLVFVPVEFPVKISVAAGGTVLAILYALYACFPEMRAPSFSVCIVLGCSFAFFAAIMTLISVFCKLSMPHYVFFSIAAVFLGLLPKATRR